MRDFNGDGKADLAVVSATTPGVLTLYQGSGSGTFSALGTALTLTGIPSPQAVAVGDLNLDGYQDLVIPTGAGGPGNTNAAVLLGKGDGSFTQLNGGPINIGITNCYGVTIADFNKDGKPDIAASSYTNGFVVLFRNTGT